MAPESKQIIVAMDDSQGARQAFSHALALAQPDGTLTAVYVREPAKEAAEEIKQATVRLYIQEALAKAEKDATARLDALFKELETEATQYGVKFTGVVLKGDPRVEICEYAEKQNPDVLVVGSRGRGALKRALLGSVSDYVLHHCACPVLVVKNHAT